MDGDLIYFKPWGRVDFYYNTEGISYSEQTIHLGSYGDAADHMELFEGTDITVTPLE